MDTPDSFIFIYFLMHSVMLL